MNPETVAALLRARMGLSLSPYEAEAMMAYLDLLLRWNSRTNLTAVRDPEAIVLRHFGESLFCARLLDLRPGETLLDYGSGAGFPGMLCALAQPEAHVTLAESQGKKAAFLRESARTLGLSFVTVHSERVSTLPDTMQFDVVTLRAVDAMQTACAEAVQWLKPSGRLAVLTTASGHEELRESLQGLSWDEAVPVPDTHDRIVAVAGPDREAQGRDL